MKTVISLGGFLFGNSNDIENISHVISEIAERNEKIFVVCGGGEIARKSIKIARELGADETFCDYIGIEATRINAMLFIASLMEKGLSILKDVPSDYKDAAKAKEKIVVMGGTSPGHTTDAVAAILAEYVGADILVIATSVDGIYNKDPVLHKNAIKYDEITPRELLSISMPSEMIAGSHYAVDPIAVKIIERSRIKTVVINGKEPRNIVYAVEGRREKHKGTEILPENLIKMRKDKV